MRRDLGTRAITIKTFEKQVEKWINVARFNECGLIINPVNDHFYNVPQFLENKTFVEKILGKYTKKYLLFYAEMSPGFQINDLKNPLLAAVKDKKIDLTNEGNIDFGELVDLLDKKGYSIIVFLLRIEESLNKINGLLIKLQDFYRLHKISFICFSGLNLTNKRFDQIKKSSPSLFQNVIYQPYYDNIDADYFIDYCENLWNIKVPSDIRIKVLENCGGNFWLIKQAIRFFRDNPKAGIKDVLYHENILEKASIVWDQLYPDEKKVALKIINGNSLSIQEKSILEYLVQVRFVVKKSKGKYSFSIQLINKVLEEQLNRGRFIIKNDYIYLDNELISANLSQQEEKILKFFIKKSNLPISRSEIGELIWKDDEDAYSDWALDRLVFRLRSRLTSLGLPKSVIFTKKGYGYVFKN